MIKKKAEMLVTVLFLMVSCWRQFLCVDTTSIPAAYSTVTNDTSQENLQPADSTHRKDPNTDASFYFANVGPHGFEYRAVLDHGDNPFNLRKRIGSFFNGLPGFPQFQNNLPPLGEIFVKVAPTTKPLSVYPILPEIHHHPTNHPAVQKVPPGSSLDELFRRKDVSLPPPTHQKLRAEDYPKIFKFNDERINIVDFDREKKYGKNHATLSKGDYLDPEKILRSKFLILHGGLFRLEKSGYEHHKIPQYQGVQNKGGLPKHSVQYY